MSQQQLETGPAHDSRPRAPATTSQPGRGNVLEKRGDRGSVPVKQGSRDELSVPALPINAPLKRVCSWQALPARKSIKPVQTG